MQCQLSKFFITTPIFYVNARPHIGHVYSVLLADAQKRFQKLKRNPAKSIFFTTGTDEHGLKIQQAAVLNGMKNPKDFCDKVSNEFKTTFQSFNVENDDFVRTTEERHKRAVTHFWQNLSQKGLLTKTTYSSWYCVQDETFLSEHQIDKDRKISLESGHPVEWAEEENYTFPLQDFRPQVASWAKEVIHPSFHSYLEKFLEKEQSDLSVSRPSSRLHWGVAVPNDPSQTIYVWLDALINYLTVCGYPDLSKEMWPPSVHVIGKDILKFHAIYWPSFLMAAGIDLPEKIVCHSHWKVNEEKMSKSKGNVVDPNEVAEKLATHEGLRYFLLKQGVIHSDGNYEQEQLINVVNNDLANTLGNLLSRLTTKNVNKSGTFCKSGFEINSPEAQSVKESLEELCDNVEKHYSDFLYYKGIDEIMECLRRVNLFVQSEKPWELRKKEENLERLEAVLNLSLNAVRICGILLQPIVPGLATKLLDKLSVENRTFEFARLSPEYNQNHKLHPDKAILFKRI